MSTPETFDKTSGIQQFLVFPDPPEEPEVMRNTRRRTVAALKLGFFGLILSLVIACASASAPVTSEPRVSASTPVVDGAAQPPRQAATLAPDPTHLPKAGTLTPAPTRFPKAASEKIKEIPATVNGLADTSESISILRSDGIGGDSQAPPIPDKGELKYPNLGSRLDGLVTSVETGQTTAQEAAEEAAVHSGVLVAVTIYLSGGVDEVVTFLEESGGDPRNVREDYVEAYVPVTLLGLASEQPGVLRVREIVQPERGQGG